MRIYLVSDSSVGAPRGHFSFKTATILFKFSCTLISCRSITYISNILPIKVVLMSSEIEANYLIHADSFH